jgi:hypothetical protein
MCRRPRAVGILATVRRLLAPLTLPALVLAGLAIAPAAQAAGGACEPSPANAVVTGLGIDTLHDAGLDGAGLTIGVISTSYEAVTTPTSAADDIASGALPGAANPCGHTQEVRVIDDGAPSDDEGRAMLQIVHAIAPAADLVFTTGSPDVTGTGPGGVVTFADTDRAMAEAIGEMVGAGVDVIVDDILEPADLAYASGFAATAARQATDSGITYAVAAGNLTHVGAPGIDGDPLDSSGYSIASWQTSAFRGTECPAAVKAERPGVELECADFDPNGGGDPTDMFTLYAEEGVTDLAEDAFLEWADAPFAVTSNLFAAFLDESETSVTDTIELDEYSGGLPVAGNAVFGDIPIATKTTRSLVIAREKNDSTNPLPVRFSFIDNDLPRIVQGAEYYRSTGDVTVGSTLVGRAANPSSITVAAASLLDLSALQVYSAGGPQVRYFGELREPDVAPARLDEPQLTEGPTVTGVDDIPTTFFGIPYEGQYVYPGTSAATPVVATVMALARQAAPYATAAQLREALTSTAVPISPRWNGVTAAQYVGAGRIDPVAYLAAVRALPAPTPSPTPAPDLADEGPSAELAATGATPALALGAALLLLLAGGAVGLARRIRRVSR